MIAQKFAILISDDVEHELVAETVLAADHLGADSGQQPKMRRPSSPTMIIGRASGKRTLVKIWNVVAP